MDENYKKEIEKLRRNNLIHNLIHASMIILVLFQLLFNTTYGVYIITIIIFANMIMQMFYTLSCPRCNKLLKFTFNGSYFERRNPVVPKKCPHCDLDLKY